MKSRFRDSLFAMVSLMTILLPSLAVASPYSSLPPEEGVTLGRMKNYGTQQLVSDDPIGFGLLKNYGTQQLVSDEPIGFSKVYAMPEQIVMTAEGIFYQLSDDEVTPVSAVSSDEAGLFVVLGWKLCSCEESEDVGEICTNPNCPCSTQPE